MSFARRAPTVRVAEVREPLPGEQQTELSTSGYVDSRCRSVIAPQIAGRPVDVTGEEGEPVKPGLIGGLLPAPRAARLSILDALRA